MYQQNRQQKLAIVLAAVLSLQSFALPQAHAQHIYPVTGHEVSLPAAEQSKQQAPQKVASGLEAFDDSPLADRTPLVLVHGIGAAVSTRFNWNNFLGFTQKSPDFSRKYKIYLYHYDSTRSVPAIGQDLQQTLKGFIGGLGGRNIKILAYSEGGLLTRIAVQDKYIDDHTSEVLTIATPFHGSPLANPEWLQQQVKNESPLSMVRMSQKLAYKITGHKYPTFRQDFHWDNFDGAIPMDQYIKSNGPVVQTDYALAKKKNFITYGSYFGMDVDPAVVPRELELKTAPPKERPMIGNLFRKNVMFSVIRNNIGKLPLAATKVVTHPEQIALKIKGSVLAAGKNTSAAASEILSPKAEASALPEPDTNTAKPIALIAQAELPSGPGIVAGAEVPVAFGGSPNAAEPVSMMMYNDGISPISSTLWLGRFTRNYTGASQNVDKLWATLKTLRGNRNTRLFAGLDHRNWMDGDTRTGEEKIQDLLNPDEPPRTVFEWIIYDLMS